MLKNFMRILLVLTAAICLSVTMAWATGTPDPGMSDVPDLLATCPAGDISYTVTVLDDAGVPCSGVLVEMDFCGCQEAMLCLYAGGQACGNGKFDRLVTTTGANGVAVFNPAAGGICGGATVDIIADGVTLGQRLVRAMDVTGNFVVEEADFTFDNIWNDYNGDGISDLSDLTVFNLHGALTHACDAPVSDENQSWGGVKSLWR